MSEMTDSEFIDFMKELILAPDTVIKKAHMERMLKIVSGLQMYKLATQNEESARERDLHTMTAQFAECDEQLGGIKGQLATHGYILDTPYNLIKTILAEIAALQDEINNPKKTYCAWCGFTVEIDDDAGSGIAEHVDTCEKHPLNRKIVALTAELAEKEKEWVGIATGEMNKATALQDEIRKLKKEMQRREDYIEGCLV
jgi:hypothetical protein